MDLSLTKLLFSLCTVLARGDLNLVGGVDTWFFSGLRGGVWSLLGAGFDTGEEGLLFTWGERAENGTLDTGEVC